MGDIGGDLLHPRTESRDTMFKPIWDFEESVRVKGQRTGLFQGGKGATGI